MRKQQIQLGAIVLLLLIGVVTFFLTKDGEPIVEESAAGEEIYVLGGIPQPFVKQVDIRNAADSFTIINGFENAIQQENNAGDSRYSIPGLDTATLNQTTLKSVMTTAASLPAKQVVAEAGAELGQYGLADPAATVTVTYEDGSATLLVGGDAPGNAGVYVRKGDTVYLVESGKAAGLKYARFSFVNSTITAGNSQTTQFTKIHITGSKYPEPITITKGPDTEVSQMIGTGNYQLGESPNLACADFNSVDALRTVFGLSATAVVDTAKFMDATAAEYGLATPYINIDVLTEGDRESADYVEPFILIFSEPDETGNVYVQCSLTDYIYQTSAANLPFFGLTEYDYLSKVILQPHIDTIASMEVQEGDAVYFFDFAGAGSDLQVSLGNLELDTETFRKFYGLLISASYEGEIGAEDDEEQAGISAADSATLQEIADKLAAMTPEERERYLAANESSTAEEPEIGEELGTAENDEEEALAEGTDDDAQHSSGADSAEAAAPPEGPQIEDVHAGTLLQIVYHYNNGQPDDVVTFMPGSSPRRPWVALNGGRAYYAKSTYVDQVVEELGKLAAGGAVGG